MTYVAQEKNPNSPFQWNNDEYADLAKTFASAIKYNDGFFKTAKQANFLKNNTRSMIERRTDTPELKQFFGFDLPAGCVAVEVAGSMRWCEYGAKSVQRVAWFYILDDLGIVAKYKLKFIGNLKDGSHPDPKKTACEWTRTSTVLPEWATEQGRAVAAEVEAAKAAEKAAMKFLGAENEVILNVAVALEKIIDKGQGQWGYEYTSIFNTTTGEVLYWNNIPKTGTKDGWPQEGDTYLIKRLRITKQFTTKAGIPAVSITRPTFAK